MRSEAIAILGWRPSLYQVGGHRYYNLEAIAILGWRMLEAIAMFGWRPPLYSVGGHRYIRLEDVPGHRYII